MAEADKNRAEARSGKGSANGKVVAGAADPAAAKSSVPKPVDPKLLADAEALRTRIHAALGQVVLALSGLPRYRDQTLADLRTLIVEPLIRDRVLLALPKAHTAEAPGAIPSTGLAGIAIWANVSDAVDAKIREQVKARVFPVRLKPEEWTSGDKAWLFDVIAPNPTLASAVLAGLGRHVKAEELNVHPVAAKQVDVRLLRKASDSSDKVPGP